MKLSLAFTKEGREAREAARRQAKRKKRARELLRMCGDAPEDLAMGWAEAEQRNDALIAEVAGMKDKWTPPDEVAELQLDLSKPPGERKYCAGCTLPEKCEALSKASGHLLDVIEAGSDDGE